jgi:hypothetical protein
MEKVLFLDVDGVLTSTRYIVSKYRSNKIWKNSDLDFEAVQRLVKIVKDTNCSIVVSSTWRCFGIGPNSKIYKSLLEKDGKLICDAIIDKTSESLKGFCRGDQIQEWINNNKFKGNFVILDDDSDMRDLKIFLVKTNTEEGLTDFKMQEVINRLNKILC